MKVFNNICITITLFTFTYIAQIQCQLRHRRNDNSIQSGTDDDNLYKGVDHDKGNRNSKNKEDCWMKFNATHLFNEMDRLNDEYADVRKEFKEAVGNKEFDAKMLNAMLKSRAMSDRAVQLAGSAKCIPAGLNVGGHCILRLAESVLFFHRMKLRNDTRFRINYLHSNLEDMVLTARLSLNDLHLVGTYERSITDRDPSVLYYTPTFGQVEFLLKDVSYKMEGRYRLLKDKLYLEMVLSEISVNGGILMMYSNQTTHSKAISLHEKNIEDFLERVKSDLNKWLLDYFNDYLIFFDLAAIENNDKLQQFDKKKSLALNDYFDTALTEIRKRLQKINATSVVLPNFSIHSMSSLQINLKDGLLYGLDSIYRRSVVTGSKKGNIRNVDAIIGFSSLKVVYKYEAILAAGTPALNGMLVLSADELTAHMGLSLVKQPESADLIVDYIHQMKPESLTVEGSANKMIANFQHLLELHIIAIMTNSLLHQIKLLTTLTRCTPGLVGYIDPNDLPYQERVEDSRSDAEAEEVTSPAPSQETTDEGSHPKNNTDTGDESENDVTEPNQSNDEDIGDSDNNSDIGENSELSPVSDNENTTESNEKNSTKTSFDDYIFAQEESLEVQLPVNASIPKNKMFVKHNEKFSFRAE